MHPMSVMSFDLEPWMPTALIPLALPPVPILVAAVVVLLGLVTVLVVLARRRRAAQERVGEQAGELSVEERSQDVEEEPGPVGDEKDPEDPRSLRMLVRTLERTVEELSAELAHAKQARSESDPSPAEGAGEHPVPTSDVPTSDAAAARRSRLVGEALVAGNEGDLPARLDAATDRTGAPRSFARPVLAAGTGAGLPEPRRVPDLPASGAAGTQQPAEAPVDTPAAAPADTPVETPVDTPVATPAEPERVLPVPAPPPAPPARRRRLFGRGVA